MAYTNEMGRKSFFGPLVKYRSLYILYNKEKNKISDIYGLNGKTVYVEKSSNTLDVLRANYKNCKYVSCSLDQGMKAVNDGKGDACVCVYETALYFIKQYDLKNLKMVDSGLVPEKFRIVGNDQELIKLIEREFYAIQQDGSYYKIYNKWFNSEYNINNVSKIIYIVSLCLLFAVLFLYIFNNMFKRHARKATDILSGQNKSLRLALNIGKIGVWRFNVKERRFYNVYNNNFPPDGKDADEELLNYHPDDRSILSKAVFDAAKGMPPAKSICVRMRMDDNNEWKYIEKEMSCVRDNKGCVTDVIGTHKDVTELMIVQKKLKEDADKINYVLSNSGTLIWTYCIKDDKFLIYEKSDKLYNEMSGDEYVTRCDSKDRPAAKEDIIKMRKAELGAFRVQRRSVISKNIDDDTYFIINGIPVANDDGNITDYFGIANDITNLMQTQHKLEEETIKAQKADKLKSMFLSNMSHEIRTPLNAIVGFSELLQETSDNGERKQYFAFINKNTELLLSLINDILDLSKMESGTMEYHIKEFDLSSLFKTIYGSFSGLLHSTDIQFIVDIPYESCIIKSDPQRIQQVITNFITNAFKYTDKGYVKISYESINSGIKIFVEDTGVGIEKNKQSLIFNRFEKLGSFKQGTGLGLSICKSIVTTLKGEIGVDSKPSKGSIFWMWLPIKPIMITLE